MLLFCFFFKLIKFTWKVIWAWGSIYVYNLEHKVNLLNKDYFSDFLFYPVSFLSFICVEYWNVSLAKYLPTQKPCPSLFLLRRYLFQNLPYLSDFPVPSVKCFLMNNLPRFNTGICGRVRMIKLSHHESGCDSPSASENKNPVQFHSPAPEWAVGGAGQGTLIHDPICQITWLIASPCPMRITCNGFEHHPQHSPFSLILQ